MNPTEAPDNGASEFASTGPLGGSDDNPSTHYQPTNIADANKCLPGEGEDPRIC